MTRAPVYSTRFKILATLLLAVAAGAFVAAYLTFTEGNEDPVLRSGGAGDYVEDLIPARDSQVPQQSRVGIDLVTGWSGTLVINGIEIPEDELSETPELGLIEYSPGEGRTVEQLSGGRNCVRAVVWPLSEGRDEGARDIGWCFEVV